MTQAHWLRQLEHDRFRKWWDRYEAWCARLDEAMAASETAIREQARKWWAEYQTWEARLREQDRQPASYSLVAVQRATAVAKWLVGLSGAGTVLAFAFYIQSYLSILSILSIKNDCVALRFVADANWGAVSYARWFVLSGVLALLAIALPALVGIERNLRRWQKAYKLPPLQPGLEFDGWTEFQVRRVPTVQWFMVGISSVIFFALTFNLVYSAPGSKPEGVRHYFELQCSQPSDPGPFS